MKHPQPDWTTPYRKPPRLRFGADTREARKWAKLRRLCIRIFCFAVVLTLGIYALGWALSVAPTLQ